MKQEQSFARSVLAPTVKNVPVFALTPGLVYSARCAHQKVNVESHFLPAVPNVWPLCLSLSLPPSASRASVETLCPADFGCTAGFIIKVDAETTVCDASVCDDHDCCDERE